MNLVRGSGFAALGRAALAMVRRAAPFPHLPRELESEQIEVVLPIRFSLEG